MRPLREIFAQWRTRLAVAAMVIGQLGDGHGHDDHRGAHDRITVTRSATFRWSLWLHTLGMFGLSMISGRLADNFGRPATIIAGAALLVAACLLAPLSQLTGVLAVALFLLGLGWNFCYVAGAALLTDTLNLASAPACRAAATWW